MFPVLHFLGTPKLTGIPSLKVSNQYYPLLMSLSVPLDPASMKLDRTPRGGSISYCQYGCVDVVHFGAATLERLQSFLSAKPDF